MLFWAFKSADLIRFRGRKGRKLTTAPGLTTRTPNQPPCTHRHTNQFDAAALEQSARQTSRSQVTPAKALRSANKHKFGPADLCLCKLLSLSLSFHFQSLETSQPPLNVNIFQLVIVSFCSRTKSDLSAFSLSLCVFSFLFLPPP